MRFRLPTIKIVHGVTDHILMSGKVARRPTILIRIGKQSLSKKAFMIGIALAICQVLDGVLTYIGLSLFGIRMEGNGIMRTMMHYYGMAPTLFFVKFLALGIAIGLALHSHKRRWMRPVLIGIAAFYVVLALLPWTFIISREFIPASSNKSDSKMEFNLKNTDLNGAEHSRFDQSGIEIES